MKRYGVCAPWLASRQLCLSVEGYGDGKEAAKASGALHKRSKRVNRFHSIISGLATQS